ncbi:glycoside hydrolase family 43 protein [Oceanobacillus kimchii]|uniref:glycoside hydrolase family 43 protein n=1 Tax=Oceanobacillus TaxID=182709 RepID=UPI00034D3E2A|nr:MULTISPECIES: glycoside hydrolase family 43 protein [Oceanobacillus]MCT1577683.1 glycoside hydrolase family 43 protein [Oceanobacillus kimchii]MCT2136671.1 glycoside hydrolase family 43 protein [Oceanobacillus kimchii]OEH53809.1 alpha-N-arabinofuranosidase [Oceanobacillus sp. E9]
MKIKNINPVELEINDSNDVKSSILPRKVAVELEDSVVGEIGVSWGELNKKELKETGETVVYGEVHVNDYPNPLIEQRADPYIYKHVDGYYYFTASYPLYDRIILRRSKSIQGLTDAEEVEIWHKHEKGIMSEHIWAPEIHFIDNHWYIHFAAGDRDDIWAIRPYVIECTDKNPLDGRWGEKGQVNTSFQSFSLDATTFEHQGERYLVWAQKVKEDTISNLYISKMDNPWTLKGEQVLIATPEYEWEQQGFYVNEGPAFISKNGRVYISYSASATDDRYCMGLLYADENSDLLDPHSWMKSSNPVMESNHHEFGPGHNSFTVDDFGGDVLVYHARPYKEINGNPLYDHNRHARVQQLLWRKDGFPYFASPGMRLENTTLQAKAIVKIKKEDVVT